MEQNYCQSCGMPLDEKHYSTNKDGSVNKEYCNYCFDNGSFKQEFTMAEMIHHCAQFIDEFNKDAEIKVTKEEAINHMNQFFPQLKRWKN